MSTLWHGEEDEEYGARIAAILVRLLHSGFVVEGQDRIRALPQGADFAPWFERLLDQLEVWAAGEEPQAMEVPRRAPTRGVV